MSAPCSCRGCTVAYNAGRADAAADLEASMYAISPQDWDFYPANVSRLSYGDWKKEWYDEAIEVVKGAPTPHTTAEDIIISAKVTRLLKKA